MKKHKEIMEKIKRILKKSSYYILIIHTKYTEKNINLIRTFLSKKLCDKEKIKH